MCFSILLFSTPLTCHAATEKGPYPSRRGVILVTPDKYKNLIPTGHAAIVWDKTYVIESLANGVVKGKNNWKEKKSRIYGVTVSSTTTAQDRTAIHPMELVNTNKTVTLYTYEK